MKQTTKRAMLVAVATGALLTGGAARADVKAGVDAWSRGDYPTAVREWERPAAAGDADALFNLGQAYRLGRGVVADPAQAEAFYARAAAAGHLQAADTYGLMLFQSGRREAALPYIQEAARRGDPRSAYLLGIAHFNGDIIAQDWVRAYALLTLANGQGLPQAAPALAQMDQHIPLEQRQQGVGLAVELQREAGAARGLELAAADLGVGSNAVVTTPAPQAPVVAAAATPRVPQPIPTADIPPSNVASQAAQAAQAAVADARQATGAESPAEAGASFASAAPVVVASLPQGEVVQPIPQLEPEPEPAAGTAASSADAEGPWRVQLGAFSVEGNAERLWTRLSERSELAGRTRLLVPAGRVTKLQAGGYASREEADTACRALKRAGHECLVTR